MRDSIAVAEHILKSAEEAIPSIRMRPWAELPVAVQTAIREYGAHRSGRAFRHGASCTKCVRTAERLLKALVDLDGR